MTTARMDRAPVERQAALGAGATLAHAIASRSRVHVLASPAVAAERRAMGGVGTHWRYERRLQAPGHDRR